MVPQMTVAVEHYNRIVRMIQAGEKVKMETNIAVSIRILISTSTTPSPKFPALIEFER
jgi:hypothetical protein